MIVRHDLPRYQSFLDELRTLVTPYKDVLEPNMDEVDADDLDLVGKMLPSRVLCIVTWLDDDGDEWLSRFGEKMPDYVMSGMLHKLLYG